jgi:hypothetical protein
MDYAVTKIAAFCEVCNTGWMSRLEEEASRVLGPMILHGDARELSLRDQFIISAWAVKSAMVWDQVEPKRHTVFFSEAQREHFYRRLRPAEGLSCAVYLAKSDMRAELYADAYQYRFGMGDQPPTAPDELARLTWFHCRTLMAGHLIVQIASLRVGTLATWPEVETSVSKDAVVGLMSSRSVIWPPASALTGDAFADFRDRWATPKDRSERRDLERVQLEKLFGER